MKKQLRLWKNSKGILNFVYKQRLSLRTSKILISLKNFESKNGVSKTRKSVRKVSKTQNGNEFK